jgi:hypothetical protein
MVLVRVQPPQPKFLAAGNAKHFQIVFSLQTGEKSRRPNLLSALSVIDLLNFCGAGEHASADGYGPLGVVFLG